jgi:hypothetical protein
LGIGASQIKQDHGTSAVFLISNKLHGRTQGIGSHMQMENEEVKYKLS